MTDITPDQAREWRDDARPGPWYVHTDPDDQDGTFIYDEDGHMCIAVAPAGSDYREADLTLAAAAPVLAEQIAGMRPEYRAEFQTAAGQWFPTPHRCSCSSGWGTKQQAARHAADWKDDGYATRIVRRLVSTPEVTE